MAYFCLTVIEGDAGGRRDAVTKYFIDQKVLSELGRLTSRLAIKRRAGSMTEPGVVDLAPKRETVDRGGDSVRLHVSANTPLIQQHNCQ